jgi:hypothetical protein
MVDSKLAKSGLNYIFSHFSHQHEIFPRTIMTKKYNSQILVDHAKNEMDFKNRIFRYYCEADFMDCRINAFPYNTHYRKMDFTVTNRTSASLIMLDLDLGNFDGDKQKLNKQLGKTTQSFSKIFGKCVPTILWTGNGYHIYQPIDGIIFEKEEVFHKYLPYVNRKDLTSVFLRFAEMHLSNGTADPNHHPSIKSCLLRIPGTVNSKNGEEINILQRWDGKKPSIQWISNDFHQYLIQKRINEIAEKEKRSFKGSRPFLDKKEHGQIRWIENLLRTPISDYRKLSLDLILVPYCLLIKNRDESSAFNILKEWLLACAKLRELDFEISVRLQLAINITQTKKILPMRRDTMIKNRPSMCNYFKRLQII